MTGSEEEQRREEQIKKYKQYMGEQLT